MGKSVEASTGTQFASERTSIRAARWPLWIVSKSVGAASGEIKEVRAREWWLLGKAAPPSLTQIGHALQLRGGIIAAGSVHQSCTK